MFTILNLHDEPLCIGRCWEPFQHVEFYIKPEGERSVRNYIMFYNHGRVVGLLIHQDGFFIL